MKTNLVVVRTGYPCQRSHLFGQEKSKRFKAFVRQEKMPDCDKIAESWTVDDVEHKIHETHNGIETVIFGESDSAPMPAESSVYTLASQDAPNTREYSLKEHILR